MGGLPSQSLLRSLFELMLCATHRVSSSQPRFEHGHLEAFQPRAGRQRIYIMIFTFLQSIWHAVIFFRPQGTQQEKTELPVRRSTKLFFHSITWTQRSAPLVTRTCEVNFHSYTRVILC